MGQFDRETDAALIQLNNDALSENPGAEFAEIIGDLLMLVGTGGLCAVAGGVSNLVLKVRKLAGASYTSNLIYAITAVRNDLATLYERHEELRKRIDSLQTDPKFVEAISALALHAMHTSVKDRLKRLARIVVNGVKEDDLEPEGLDDMMRAAVDLKNRDILALEFVCLHQSEAMKKAEKWPNEWLMEVQKSWQSSVFERGVAWQKTNSDDLGWKSALSRLQAFGFIVAIPTNLTTNSPGNEPYAIVPEGVNFLQRLKEIA